MMDFGFLAAANSITNTYLNQNSSSSAVTALSALDDETKKKFGEQFAEAYDSMIASKMLSENMRQSYDAMHPDNLKFHANRLGYSIDNRVIDMLQVQLSDDMTEKVISAINNALETML